jgi:tetratricopeptide (TPR) repeat protein
MPDATTSSGTSDLGRSAGTRVTVNLSGCELYASLGAYVSSRIGLGVRSLFESPDVGTIVLYPADENPDPFQSVTTLKAPQKALKSYEKAQRELAKKKPKPSSALKELRKAVEVYPGFAAAWNLMGEAYLRDEDVDGASEAFQTAIQADPGFAPPYLALAFLRLRERDFEEALHMADRVLELSPDSAEAHFYKANAFAGLGDLEEAEASLRAVLVSPEVDRFPRTHYLLGTILARTGRTEEAVSEYREYLRLEPDSRLAQAVKQQLEEWASGGLIQ